MACPFCGCETFYVKDPDDEFETYEFTLKNGEIVFSDEVDESASLPMGDETSTHCNRCAWNGRLQDLKKA